jgi:peptide/nickel transport system substrate-binding protein
MGQGRRHWWIVVSVALTLAACGNGDGDDPGTEAAEDEAVAGGTLVAAIDSDPDGLNPAVTTSGGTHAASELMFSGLVELDDDGQPTPELAESWEVTDDGATYTFTLRSG